MVAAEIQAPDLPARRVLVVDDDQDICGCLRDFFTAKGFTVHSAFSGEQALDDLKSGPPHVVVLDIMLPGISGLEVLRRIKVLCPAARVIMITGLPYPELRQKAAECGACGYVTKPFDFSDQTWAPAFSP